MYRKILLIIVLSLLCANGGIFSKLKRKINRYKKDVSKLKNDISSVRSELRSFTSQAISQANTIVELKNVRSLLLSELDALTLGGDLANVLGDITDGLGDIPLIGTQITDMIGIIEMFTNGGFKELGGSTQEVKDFANDLEECVNKFANGIINPTKALKDILKFPDMPNLSALNIDLPKFDDFAFLAMAKALLPLKSQINFVCTDGYDIIEDGFNFMTSLVMRRRRLRTDTTSRRLLSESIPCQNLSETELCEVSEIQHGVDSNENGHYQRIVSGSFFLNKYGGSDIEDIMSFHTVKFTLQMFATVAEAICIPAMECPGAEGGKSCLSAVACAGLALLTSPTDILDWLIAVADEHDGLLTFTRVQALAQDRVAIIHNQFALKAAIVSLEAHFASAKVEPEMMIDRGTNDVTDGIMMIKVSSRDLFVVGLVVIGFIIGFIVMAVLLILKCCVESREYKVVKYQSESET